MAPISGVARTGVFGIATRVDDPLSSTPRGRSSVVERQLPKLNVVGSIPIARSKYLSQIVPTARVLGESRRLAFQSAHGI